MPSMSHRKSASGSTGSVAMLTIVGFLLMIGRSAAAANLVRNSSFELDAGTSWNYAGSQLVTGKYSLIDRAHAFSGGASLKVPISSSNYCVTLSKPYRLKPATAYTLSFYVNGRPNYAVEASIINTRLPPFGPGDSKSHAVKGSELWVRHALTFVTTSNVNACTYQIRFTKPYGTSDYSIWVDAVQLEASPVATPYAPAAEIEAGFDFGDSRSDHIYFTDEAVSPELLLHNGGRERRSVTAMYEVYDYHNRLIEEGRVESMVPAGGVQRHPVALATLAGRSGAFRLLVWVKGLANTREEYNLSVLPRPHGMGIDTNSIFGGHVPFFPYFLSVMQKAGVKWNRTLSTGNQFRWKLVEPRENEFVWHDSSIALASAYGMTVLASLGEEVHNTPAWAKDAAGLPMVSKWTNFVHHVAAHYAGTVRYWEIWNEPDTEGGLRAHPALYADLLMSAYREIKASNPQAKVVGMAASLPSFVTNVLSRCPSRALDIMSHHAYPGHQASDVRTWKNTVWDPAGVSERWNTESGIKSKGLLQTPLWEEQYNDYATAPSGADFRQRTDAVIQNFAITIGGGFTKYFYYDARHTGGHDCYVAYSMFDWDQTLKPKGVAYAVLAGFFEYAVGRGEIQTWPDVAVHLFSVQGTPWAIMWAKNLNVAKRVRTRGRVYNVMGDTVSHNGEAHFASSPVYVSGEGMSENEFLPGLQVSSGVDTNPPCLSIVTAPTGPVSGERVYLRWWAVDDVTHTQRVPPYTEPGIAFSHKLDGVDADWTEWTEAGVAVGGLWAAYEKVPAGTYTFRVIARDAAGNETPEVQTAIAVLAGGPRPSVLGEFGE